MKTFEITYKYNYRSEVSKIFKAADGLDALEAAQNWATENTAAIHKVKLQEIHLGHFSSEGRVSHKYGNRLLEWQFNKNKKPIKIAIEEAKQNWIDSIKDKIL